MSKIPIKNDGYCINNFLDRIKSKLGNTEAEQLKQAAVEIVQNCVDVYSTTFGSGDVGATGTGIVSNHHKGKIPYGTTGLIYGKVQSGKTNTTIATLALAEANKFRCFIVLTSDNTWLGKQTADRFANQIKGGPVVFNWEQWKNDPREFANQLHDYINDTGVVLVSTKNVRHLENLLKVLKSAQASSVPTLIFDDEADNASLNTNEAKQAKKEKNTVPDSRIFEIIAEIRKQVANHIYLQITATPQSLLLQNLDHPCKPAFCVLSKPGNAYIGGDIFFEANSQHCCTVKAEELDQLKKQGGKINPGDNWDMPPKLKLALCCFFVGSIYKMKSAKDIDAKYSFLAHIDHKRITHSTLEKVIRSFVVELDKALRAKSSVTKREDALKWLSEAHAELSKTASNLPPLNDLVVELEYQLRNTIPKVIDATNPDKEPKYSPGINILIGGNRLGRGVTIEGLMITYYGRDAKQKTMDTVHQHARMFGYRKELLDVTRLFLPEHILEDFRAIHESDEGMREVIDENTGKIKLTPVWVGRKLRPTRANVLNPAAIGAFTPGSSIYPPDPLWKASEVKKHTDALDKLLSTFKGDDEYHEVDIDDLIKIISEMPSRSCSGYVWEDERVKQALQAMKAEGIHKGILNVRRGKRGSDGLELKNQPTRPWRRGFAQSQWLSKPRQKYPDVPVLVVMYQKGEKQNSWDDQPLYLPTLILPKNKFVFMFNYSEESEEVEEQEEDELEWNDSEEIDES
ncbi:Z1 domain-containing protein [Microcoleus sp. A003_D6]|uniref:Z1 domain-containing protein n=1 Tax=Microcoleus sp. A003_D6 TaxID=3055266 RepID=UPI002FD03329